MGRLREGEEGEVAGEVVDWGVRMMVCLCGDEGGGGRGGEQLYQE